ncbi:MAG: hypothetical protein KatS3mg108_1141 [Isosphaeraceae bacterium]|jgi:very-short-patch-repair endonuclease|nr:MAG: hypothetical protein KatS3mg108_1141 [Isosphaeraceae bacterium]
MPTDVAEQLKRARERLLDLTNRNRLINTPLERSRSRRLDIVDELSREVFRILVCERQEMSFLPSLRTLEQTGVNCVTDPGQTSGDGLPHLAQPDEGDEPEAEISERHSDRYLQTSLDDEALQDRLLKLHNEARTRIEDQGFNSLFLAMGFLKWFESPNSDQARYAPLLLLPVELHRRSANARFRLKLLEEEITTNLSLQARLRNDFRLRLPDVPDLEELNPDDYFTQVEQMIADQPRWVVQRDRMTLWFFSFEEFVIYRDLGPEIWPEGKGPSDHPLLKQLLGESGIFDPPLIGEDEPLDDRIDPRTSCHVVDCDSSQAAAIEEVRAGRTLVIQGPPGTGKSQTIVNMIAAAVRDGKTVLFVAEKMAALEVVKSRLTSLGMGEICLELHSHKANRRAVLEDLRRTLELGRPVAKNMKQMVGELVRTRDQLNEYVRQLHDPIEPLGRTPYQILGTLCRLKSRGVSPFECQIPDIAQWSESTLSEKQALLRDLAEHLTQIGRPAEHVWYGVRRTAPLFPAELDTLRKRLDQVYHGIGRILDRAERLSLLLKSEWRPAEESFQSVERLAKFGLRVRTSPEMDQRALADAVWDRNRDQIERIIERGRTLAEYRRELEGVVTAVAWQTDVGQIRADLAATGRSLFRWLSRRWKGAVRNLRQIVVGRCPNRLDEQLSLLDRLLLARSCLEELESGGSLDALGRSAFGSVWRGTDSDWDQLTLILEWESTFRELGVSRTVLQDVPSWTEAEGAEEAFAGLKSVFKPTWEALNELIKELEVDVRRVFGLSDLLECPLKDLHAKLASWRAASHQLERWIVFQRKLGDLSKAGLNMLRPQIERGELNLSSLDRLELMVCEAALRKVLRERDRIARFDGISHQRLVEEFCRLDENRIKLATTEVATAHFGRLPSGREGGEVGIIQGEIRKKRRHLPLRKLLSEAGHAMQAIKPVFMMSPLSVAQFLQPRVIEFDLLVIDEASQVDPVRAFGAICRCRQAVIVGDNRQLPPTAFFKRYAESDEELDDSSEATAATDVESILDLCVARNVPQRMLRWHYRSRHHSLIAVSNREFYDNRLFVVPSSDRGGAARGLQFRYIANGVFDRGRTRTNRIEAQAVAQAILEHARQYPDRSLGVGTFSVSQRDLIVDELELLRRNHPETEEFFSESRDEPFFVKNLENIQGDERDVIFISVGYGPDEDGVIRINFGPLTKQGGERRLNVLISRARQQCVVFSSLRADDINLRQTRSRGVEAFKAFLQYAETGRMDLSRPSGREWDSEFEAEVADALRNAGWDVDPQVGIAGFFIDVAVVDPDVPTRYLLGIECDGASYHSARWARDRDRLRQAVLEAHGWTIHRIWSTDWFYSRDQQLGKLLKRLEELRERSRSEGDAARGNGSSGRGVASPARLSDSQGCPAADPHCETSPVMVIDAAASPTGICDAEAGPVTTDGTEVGIPRERPVHDPDNGQLSVPYIEAEFRDPRMAEEIHELWPSELAEIVSRIVEIEGPIHEDEIARRVTSLWGLQRTGNRITQAVKAALKYAVRAGRVDESTGFYWCRGQRAFPVRNRETVASATLRKPNMLPPQEIDSAILHFVASHISARSDETTRFVARSFGFQNVGPNLRERIESRIAFLISEGKLVEDRDVLRAGKRNDP